MSIFVNIASYRDPELVPTIEDCIKNAHRPESLRFGICNQHDDGGISLNKFRSSSEFRIVDVDAKDSMGCCWARSRSQGLYDGEDYTLQLDSHHRFEPGWDDTLIQMLQSTEVEKPIITAYAGSYDAETGKHKCSPWKLKAKPFGKDGALVFVPITIPEHQSLTKPIPARFLSGHFCFTLGRHCADVPYDPNLYFHGEEPTMAARSWTRGYDLFHPHKIVVWHQYHRNGRSKHWDDHPQRKHEIDTSSKQRVRRFFGMEEGLEDFTGFNLGTVRSLQDYERFAGIDFRGRRLHSECLDAKDPPTSFVDDPSWEASMSTHYSVLLDWKTKSLHLPEDTSYVHYFIDDKDGRGMWDEKATKENGFQPPLMAEFSSCREPANLIIWPHTPKGPGPKKYSIPLSDRKIYCTSV